MLMNANDVFALVVNFINLDQQPKQITIGFLKLQKQRTKQW
jgi:hypothetical protein